jgi:hypothetical protein
MCISKNIYTILYNITIITHWLVLVGLILAIPMSVLFQPWYIALVIMTVVIRIAFSPSVCPLSSLECLFARKAGLPENKWFIKSHVLPAVRSLNSHLGRLYAHLMKHN